MSRWIAASVIDSTRLAFAGASLLVYGSAFSQHTVHFDEEVTPAPPPEPPPPPFIRPGPGGAMPPFIRPPRPPQKPIIMLRHIVEGEAKIVLEATRGGVMRMEDGRLKRTYSGAPPSGCPT